MKEDLLRRVQALDQEYFGPRSVGRLIRALAAQVQSLVREPTLANLYKQVGDIQFVLVSIARNNGWDLQDNLESTVVRLENRKQQRHYYESHVTIEPVFQEDRQERLSAIALEYGFHVATLLMQKRPGDTPERSANDSFCTARGISYSDLEDRMVRCCEALVAAGFTVWRYKIESTLLDSRYDDSLLPLKREGLPEKELHPRAPADGALPGRHEP